MKNVIQEIWPPESHREMFVVGRIVDFLRFKMHMNYDETKQYFEIKLGRTIDEAEWEDAMIDVDDFEAGEYSPTNQTMKNEVTKWLKQLNQSD